MDISERKKKILSSVIEEYIATAEPVGSKVISPELGLSSATIRNEMAELTAMGYLEQPHTSAGRVPSAAGYRMYVNELMRQHKLSVEETETINSSLNQKIQELDKLVGDVGRLISSLTQYPAYALAVPAPATIKRFDLIYVDSNTFIIVAMLSNNTVKNKLVHLPFSVEQAMIQRLSTLFNASFTSITESEVTELLISSTERAARDSYGLVSVIAGFVIEILSDSKTGEAYVAGARHILQQPEYRDPEKAQRLLDYLSDQGKLLKLPALSDIQVAEDVKVFIGPENAVEELRDSSVVMASYNVGDNMQGLIGVVGPTRMDYSKIAAKLRYIASGLSRLLSTAEPPPGANNKLVIKGDDIDE